MKLELTHTYQCATEALFEFFSQPDRIEEKYSAIGCTKVRILECKQDLDALQLTGKRDVQSNVPSVLKRLLGSENTIKQQERWNSNGEGQFKCDMNVELIGVPIKIRGTMTLVPTEQGCENRIEFQLKSALPFIGNKLSRFACEEIGRMAEAEYQYLQGQLDEVLVE